MMYSNGARTKPAERARNLRRGYKTCGARTNCRRDLIQPKAKDKTELIQSKSCTGFNFVMKKGTSF